MEIHLKYIRPKLTTLFSKMWVLCIILKARGQLNFQFFLYIKELHFTQTLYLFVFLAVNSVYLLFRSLLIAFHNGHGMFSVR